MRALDKIFLSMVFVAGQSACDINSERVNTRSAQSTDKGNNSEDAGRALTQEEMRSVNEMCKSLGLEDRDCALLRNLFRTKHEAMGPLKKMVDLLDAKAAAYLGKNWIASSVYDHVTEKLAKLEKSLQFALGQIDENGNLLTRIEILTADNVTPKEVVLPVGISVSLRAIAVYGEDKSKRDLSNLVKWEEVSSTSAKSLVQDSVSNNVFKGSKAGDSGSIKATDNKNKRKQFVLVESYNEV